MLQEQPSGVLRIRPLGNCASRRLRDRRNESARVFVLRRIEDGFRRAAFYNLTFMENADPMAQGYN